MDVARDPIDQVLVVPGVAQGMHQWFTAVLQVVQDSLCRWQPTLIALPVLPNRADPTRPRRGRMGVEVALLLAFAVD
jgi:hypothetical protein